MTAKPPASSAPSPFGNATPIQRNSPFADKEQANLGTIPTPDQICCPKCKKKHFIGRMGQYGLERECLECHFKWSGGFAVSTDPSQAPQVPGVTVVDDFDSEMPQFTGASFRDPDKNF